MTTTTRGVPPGRQPRKRTTSPHTTGSKTGAPVLRAVAGHGRTTRRTAGTSQSGALPPTGQRSGATARRRGVRPRTTRTPGGGAPSPSRPTPSSPPPRGRRHRRSSCLLYTSPSPRD
eukprot:5622806-Alexandrium_andersonii.AAC.1